MKLYHIYNENFEITSAQFFEEGEQPENAVFVQNCNYIKPMVNPDTLEIYEGATPEEIAELNKQSVQNLKLGQYQELLLTDWYYTRYIETGQEVPLEIKQQRQEIKDKYDTLIQEINNE